MLSELADVVFHNFFHNIFIRLSMAIYERENFRDIMYIKRRLVVWLLPAGSQSADCEGRLICTTTD